jgi:pimeloyl-ACP methyl ester carboxylesterase
MLLRRTPTVVLAAFLLVACSPGGSGGSGGSTTTTGSPASSSSEPAESAIAPTSEEPGSSQQGEGAAAGAPAAFEPGPIEWESFDETVDVATVEVPVDYDDPDGPRFDLFLARYNALDQDDKIGSLLINRGGPGFGGSDMAIFASEVFDRPLLERFDIIGWDPRGTGESDPPIDCIDDYDKYFSAIDGTPETDAERARLVDTAEEFAARCVDNNTEIFDHVGTNNSARDIDAIRRALGEDQISYFGFSYGSELGATWATLFPDTVRAVVFDGASDPEADPLEGNLQQVRGFQSSLDTFLNRCSQNDECAFHNDGDASAAFDILLDDLDADPLPSDDGRPPVNRDVALTAVVQAMYSETYWPALDQSLTAAQRDDDGSGLLALNDSYYRRQPDGTYGNELEAFQVISCADRVERVSVAEADDRAALYTEAAPQLSPEGSTGGYFCTFFPDATDPRIEITGAGAGPIVVIGTTGDPATPFESTVAMSDSLEDGRLVIVEADRHTGYGVNRCVVDVVNDYLIDLEAPEDGTECR